MTSVLIDEDRFARQQELVPPEKRSATSATVIGVGAIGRQVSLQLAAIGIRQLQLVDFDHVELTNVTTQGYWQDDIGQTKVKATAAAIARIDPDITVEAICDRFRPRIPLGGAVFCCVDRIETRAVIWRTARECCRFWADGRMLAEVIRVLVATDIETRDYYRTTLFPASNGAVGKLHRPQHDLRCRYCRWADGASISGWLAVCQWIATRRSICWLGNGRFSEAAAPVTAASVPHWLMSSLTAAQCQVLFNTVFTKLGIYQ